MLEQAETDLKEVFVQLMKLVSTENPGAPPGVPLQAVVFYWDQMLRCVKVLHDQRKFYESVSISVLLPYCFVCAASTFFVVQYCF